MVKGVPQLSLLHRHTPAPEHMPAATERPSCTMPVAMAPGLLPTAGSPTYPGSPALPVVFHPLANGR